MNTDKTTSCILTGPPKLVITINILEERITG